MRDWPRRVTSWSSLTDSSLSSSSATMRSRVGSDKARRDFKVELINFQKAFDARQKCYIILS